MKYSNKFIYLAFAFMFSLFPAQANEEPKLDETKSLTECIIGHISQEDKTNFIQWLVVMYAQHPSAEGFVITEKDALNKVNKKYADMFMRLVTEDCKEEVKIAIKKQGANALYSPFRVFGELAGGEVFQAQEVEDAVNGSSEFLDEAKLRRTFSIEDSKSE
ncbi:MAG TPA: hypothetical protein V6C96_00650 [Vampirovibrionales bacterium]